MTDDHFKTLLAITGGGGVKRGNPHSITFTFVFTTFKYKLVAEARFPAASFIGSRTNETSSNPLHSEWEKAGLLYTTCTCMCVV